MTAEGILLVDKPQGITSHDAVDGVRRALGTRKVGHAGTLDPLATGLLVMGIGRATRLLRYLSGLDKAYDGAARLGMETDTLDAEGEVVRSSPVDVSRGDLERATAVLVGGSLQRPPAYSAVKVGGRALHRAARSGRSAEAEPRPIWVAAFDVTDFDGDTFRFHVECSSGAYVRVLVSDVGRTLGCGAHLTALRRTRVGPFRVEDARPPDAPDDPLPVEAAVAHLPRVTLEEEEARAAANGRPLGPAGVAGPYGVFGPDGLVAVYRDDGAKAVPEMVLAPPPD